MSFLFCLLKHRTVPGVVLPITVGRTKSIRLVKKAYKGDRIIGVVAQNNTKKEEPVFNDLYKIGTVARILKMLVLPDGNTTIIIQGQQRFELGEPVKEEPFLKATFRILKESDEMSEDEINAITSSLKEAAYKVLKLNPEIPKEAQVALENIQSYTFLTHFLSSNINAEVSDKQKLLETNNPKERAELLLEIHAEGHSDA